jgi:ABC-type transport system substrate-binding protein
MWIPAPYSLCVNFWEIVASEKPRTDWHNSKQWPLFNIKVTTELVERIAAAAKRSTPAEKKALSEEVYHSVLEEVPNW